MTEATGERKAGRADCLGATGAETTGKGAANEGAAMAELSWWLVKVGRGVV